MASMSHLAQNEIQSDQRSGRPESTASHRRRPLRVLFVHRDADAIESCLQELKKAQFTVSADFVLTLAQCTEQLRFQSYDAVSCPMDSLPMAVVTNRRGISCTA